MKALTFQNITLTPVKQDTQIWLSSSDLAKALGYSQSNAVAKLYNENADEFRSDMTMVIETMTNGINNSQRKIKTRIFSLRGCHLIAMFARTKVAKEFRQWVLDILDKEVGEPVQVNPRTIKINDTQAYQIQKTIKQKCQDSKTHYQTIYHALYDAFGVKSYKDLLASDFEQAMAFIMGFEFTPTLNLAAIQNILTHNAHQNRKAQSEINGIVSVVKGLLHHLEDVQNRLSHAECCVYSLQKQLMIQ